MLELRNIKEPGPRPASQNLKVNNAKKPKFVVYTKDVSVIQTLYLINHFKHLVNFTETQKNYSLGLYSCFKILDLKINEF